MFSDQSVVHCMIYIINKVLSELTEFRQGYRLEAQALNFNSQFEFQLFSLAWDIQLKLRC